VLTSAIAEVIWVQSVLQELGIKQSSTPVMANPTFHERMKRVEVDYHFVCERVAKGLLDIGFISTND
jgi:hypothetical protein